MGNFAAESNALVLILSSSFFCIQLITRVPIRSEAHLILVLNFCVKHDLRHQYREILRVWGMRLFRQGKPVPAIDRLAQAGCGDIVNEVIQDVFNRCIQQGKSKGREEGREKLWIRRVTGQRKAFHCALLLSS